MISLDICNSIAALNDLLGHLKVSAVLSFGPQRNVSVVLLFSLAIVEKFVDAAI